MKLHSGRVDGSPSLQEGDNFTGDAWVDPMLDDNHDGVMSYNVFFSPRSRTNWHRHSRGQILYITGGSGHVVSRRGDAVGVRSGDVVWTEPDEEHWHGAGEGSYMIHTAVSLGEAVWLEPVSEEQYATAAGARADA